MKKLLVFFTGLLFTISFSFANGVKAYLHHTTFFSPSQGPFIETYLSVIGNSVVFTKKGNGKFQSTIEVLISFKQKDSVITDRKYDLLSPEVDDTLGAFPNFIDQQRFTLTNGEYDFEITISDKNNNTGKPFTNRQKVSINFPTDQASISDIQLLELYKKSVSQNILSKSGYDLIPYVSNFYPDNFDTITFYAEIYNMDKVFRQGEMFGINYYIESYEKFQKVSSCSRFSQQAAAKVNVLLSKIPINDLPSGNYNLAIEALDKEDKIVAVRKFFFQRSNKSTHIQYSQIATELSFAARMTNKDTLSDYIRSLRPISSESEKMSSENQLKAGDVKLMQQYFYNFWLKRDEKDPEKAWLNYALEVLKVNNAFGTRTIRGYDSDRGRVYLQYGPPDVRTESPHEPNAYPYEIWQYYKLKDQTNRKFVFCNFDLVSNNYRLIHSDATGEMYDYQWQSRLHERTSPAQNIDQETIPENYGGHSLDNFNNPK